LICLSLVRCSCGGTSGIAYLQPPESAKAGEWIAIKFDVSSRTGNVKDRFTDISLRYRLRGQSDFKVVRPTLVSSTTRMESYVFMIPPYPDGTKGKVEYTLEFKLDGLVNHQEIFRPTTIQ
jgi:hypothetical protein